MNFKSRPRERRPETCGSIPSRRIFFFSERRDQTCNLHSLIYNGNWGPFPRV